MFEKFKRKFSVEEAYNKLTLFVVEFDKNVPLKVVKKEFGKPTKKQQLILKHSYKELNGSVYLVVVLKAYMNESFRLSTFLNARTEFIKQPFVVDVYSPSEWLIRKKVLQGEVREETQKTIDGQPPNLS